MPALPVELEQSMLSVNRKYSRTLERNIKVYKRAVHEKSSIEEVSELFDISVETVKGILVRVRRAIKNKAVQAC
jgi:DNA-directed RNA polymerase specialized sigma24 family protein